MPTYEFVCPAGHEFTRFYRKMSDSVAELPCPECGEAATRQISGGAGLVFKGSGFYITDYGKDGKKHSAPAKSGASGDVKSGDSAGGSAGAESTSSPTKTPDAAAGGTGTSTSSASSGSAKKKSASSE